MFWEHPLTKQERSHRVTLGVHHFEKQLAEERLKAGKRMRLECECAALRAENEWLIGERATPPEEAMLESVNENTAGGARP